MTWEYEEKAWANGYGSGCGVDEAGRGPVAGPVCAAAVILPAGIVIEGLNDSKKLSEKKREKLFDEITENALAWSVSLVDERVIDEINILQATYRAMKQAVDGLTRPADFVYVDGNRSQGLEQPHECVVSGDAKIPSVAAASIIAKVTRDRLMRQFAEQFPLGEFEIPRRAHLAEQFLRTAEILESGMNDVSCAWGGVLVDLHACQSSVFLLRWEIGSRFFEQIAHVLPYSARDRRMVHRVQVHAIDSLSHEVADLLARIDDARLA